MQAMPGDPKLTYTRPASITGVGEPYVLNGWAYCGFSTSKSLRSRRIFPVSQSAHRANNWRPSSVAVVIQSCLSQITGEDQARPWIGVFHFTFCSSLQFTGNPVFSEEASPRGPRNCGQFNSSPGT